MLRLKTFGSLVLSSDGLERAQPRRRLALLARLAPSGSVGVSRAELLADLWSERDANTARHSLDQLLYELRQSLDASPIKGTAQLRLDSSVITSDVAEFMSALDRADCGEAVAQYDGPFLQGFYIQGAAEFERWVETTRDRLAAHHRRALEQLAREATSRRAHDEAVRWWRRLGDEDRLSSRTALGLMRALADAGDSAGALEHARLYDRIVRTELEAAPDPTVMAFAVSLRRSDGNTSSDGHRSADASAAARPLPELAMTGTADVRQKSDARVGLRSRRVVRYASLALTVTAIGYGATRSRPGRNLTAGAATLPMSMVVLPMIDQSADGTDDHLADGMTEQLISALASTEGLRVTGRTSAFVFKGSRIGARAIADSLHVSTVLESALQRDGSRLRVTVRLVEPTTGLTRWAETYDRQLHDIFAVQDDIVRAVARELRVRLTGRAVKRQTSNIAAYELYLRARDPVMTRSDSTVRAALGLLEQAIALDPGYADAYAAMAELYATAVWGSNVGPDGRRDLYRRAREAARHAIALDTSSAEAHLALGVVHSFGYELRDAERELKRARELDPGVRVSGYLAAVYRWTGRTADGLAEVRREVRDDPLSAGATAELAHALYFAGLYDQARTEIDKVIALQPPLRRAFAYRAEILLAQRRWGDAIAALRPPVPQLPRGRALLGYALARSGQRPEAMQILSQLRSGVATGQGSAFAVALVHAGLGDFDSAYVWLDSAIEEYSMLPMLMGPAFDDLRNDPRFARIRTRLGIATR